MLAYPAPTVLSQIRVEEVPGIFEVPGPGCQHFAELVAYLQLA